MLEHAHDAREKFILSYALIDPDRLSDRPEDSHPRIKGLIRVLKHDLYPPPVLAKLPLFEIAEIRPLEEDASF